MTASNGFIELLQECLAGLGPVNVRRMFGGAGVYLDGVMFALVADDVLYFKADAKTQVSFEEEGLKPFVYTAKNGRRTVMSYWRVPERLYDEPEEMVAWARVALAVARSAQAASAKTVRPRGGRRKPRAGTS